MVTMSRTRGPELSAEFKDYIRTQWMFKGKNAYQICIQINQDTELLSKFGKATPAGIHYHIIRVREELENTVSEDALDVYIGEFIRARLGFEQDVDAVDQLIVLAGEDIELVLKLRRHRHEIKLDSFKMLQDNELTLQVKKLKKERALYRPKKDVIKEIGVSEGINETDNQ